MASKEKVRSTDLPPETSRADPDSRPAVPPESAEPAPPFSFSDDILPMPELQQVLKQRAQALAQPPMDEETGSIVEVVVFRLGAERYAIEAQYVETIQPLQDLTPVPCTPSFCVGVVNLRGKILSVVDLHEFLGLEKVVVDENTQVIAVNVNGVEVGLLANDVHEVSPLLVEKLTPVLPTTSRVAAEYTRGVTPDMLIWLDLEALLHDRRMIVHEEP